MLSGDRHLLAFSKEVTKARHSGAVPDVAGFERLEKELYGESMLRPVSLRLGMPLDLTDALAGYYAMQRPPNASQYDTARSVHRRFCQGGRYPSLTIEKMREVAAMTDAMMAGKGYVDILNAKPEPIPTLPAPVTTPARMGAEPPPTSRDAMRTLMGGGLIVVGAAAAAITDTLNQPRQGPPDPVRTEAVRDTCRGRDSDRGRAEASDTLRLSREWKIPTPENPTENHTDRIGRTRALVTTPGVGLRP